MFIVAGHYRILTGWTKFSALRRTFVRLTKVGGHGAFSAGLSAYRRYVHYLEAPDFGETDECERLSKLSQIENEQLPFNGDLKRVDFANPDACTGRDPVSCVVEGKEFYVHHWRDILTELTEHFLATKPRAQELTWRSIC